MTLKSANSYARSVLSSTFRISIQVKTDTERRISDCVASLSFSMQETFVLVDSTLRLSSSIHKTKRHCHASTSATRSSATMNHSSGRASTRFSRGLLPTPDSSARLTNRRAQHQTILEENKNSRKVQAPYQKTLNRLNGEKANVWQCITYILDRQRRHQL